MEREGRRCCRGSRRHPGALATHLGDHAWRGACRYVSAMHSSTNAPGPSATRIHPIHAAMGGPCVPPRQRLRPAAAPRAGGRSRARGLLGCGGGARGSAVACTTRACKWRAHRGGRGIAWEVGGAAAGSPTPDKVARGVPCAARSCAPAFASLFALFALKALSDTATFRKRRKRERAPQQQQPHNPSLDS
jgi:hypothetical protein